MITPATGNLRNERPAVTIPLAVKWLTKLFPGFVRRRSQARLAQLELEATQVIHQVRQCHDRTELERLIGKPVYLMAGRHYGWRVPGSDEWHRPDHVEVYRSRGLLVELKFPRGNDFDTLAFPDITPWDAVIRLLDQKLI